MDIKTNHNYDNHDILLSIFQFVAKNILGLLSIMFGVVAKVYIIRRQAKRISKSQCIFSVIMAGLAGSVAYCAVVDMSLAVWHKAVITGFTPIVIEPVVLRVLMHINPFLDKLTSWIENFFTNTTTKNN